MAAGLEAGPSGALGDTPAFHEDSAAMLGHTTTAPADFTEPRRMLAVSPAVLHGKIVRGGMGTGMPYWGPIFTDDEVWALVEYLMAFQFDSEPLDRRTSAAEQRPRD